MRVALLLTAAWLLALLGWLAGANTVKKPSENPSPSTADMWERLVINITLGLPLGDEHPLCSDPLMRLTLRTGIRCGLSPRIVFRWLSLDAETGAFAYSLCPHAEFFEEGV